MISIADDSCSPLRRQPALKTVKLFIFVAMSVSLTWILVSQWPHLDITLLTTNMTVPCLLLSASAIVICLKGFSLSIAGGSAGITTTFREGVSLFCRSTFVDLATMTGTIGGDVSKFYFWKETDKKRRIRAVLLFRCGTILGPLALALTLLDGFFFIIAVTVLVIMAGAAWARLKKHGVASSTAVVLVIAATNALSLMLRIGMYLVSFETFGLAVDRALATTVYESFLYGFVSQIPLGMGVREITLAVRLEELLAVGNIIAVSVWVRCFGELPSALAGWVLTVRGSRGPSSGK